MPVLTQALVYEQKSGGSTDWSWPRDSLKALANGVLGSQDVNTFCVFDAARESEKFFLHEREGSLSLVFWRRGESARGGGAGWIVGGPRALKTVGWMGTLARYQIGAHVRDAACYVVWALVERFDIEPFPDFSAN